MDGSGVADSTSSATIGWAPSASSLPSSCARRSAALMGPISRPRRMVARTRRIATIGYAFQRMLASSTATGSATPCTARSPITSAPQPLKGTRMHTGAEVESQM